MARNKWRGDALAVAQISKFTVTAVGVLGDTISVTINRKTITYTMLGTETATSAAAALVLLLTASQIAEFLEVAWTSVGADVYGTAATAGVPFTFTNGATGGATVGAITTPTASAGPNHWDTAANWTLNAVPVNTNDIDLESSAVSILYGLAQSGVTAASLNIASTFTGKIGLPATNAAGYVEYRDTYLQIGATTCTIGSGLGSGSSQLKIDFGAIQTAVVVYATATGGLSGNPAAFFKGTHASNTLTVVSGAVGIGFDLGTNFRTATLSIGGDESGGGIGPNVQIGAACQMADVNVQGGKVLFMVGTATPAVTNLVQDGGEVTVNGPITVTAHQLRGGKFYWDGSGTVTTLNNVGGYWDASRDPRAKTVTNCTVYGKSTMYDPAKHVTFSNPIQFPEGLDDVTLKLGKQITLVRA